MGWLGLVNGAFYLIGSAVFQYMEYHLTTEGKLFYFSFFKVLAGLTRLVLTLRPCILHSHVTYNRTEEEYT
jgi:hypothetical protein